MRSCNLGLARERGVQTERVADVASATFLGGTRSYGGSQNPLGQRPLECAEALAPKQGRVGGHMMQGRVCGLIRMREGASPDGRGRFPARGALRLAPACRDTPK
jgi:hypothetical protein